MSYPNPLNIDRTVTSGLEERAIRIETLIEEKGMTPKAAAIVVDAAMYGVGCLDKKFANKQGAQNVTD